MNVAHADSVLGELRAALVRVNKLFDACDRWLTDPDDPTRYDIGPRAGDVKVTYEFQEMNAAGKVYTKREKALLSTMLDRINDAHDGEWTFTLVVTKHADPRELLLKASETLRGQFELIAKILGELKEQPANVNILVASPDWLRLRTCILQALEPYNAARLAVAEALSEAERVR